MYVLNPGPQGNKAWGTLTVGSIIMIILITNTNTNTVRSEDPYKLMCVQGVQRQDVTQCVQPGILYKQLINHTELYMHNFLLFENVDNI